MKKTTKQATKRDKGLTSDEIGAMKEHLKELNAEKEDGESVALAAIAKMPDPDRTMAKRLHAIIMKNAPTLIPRTWYGMPAYTKDGNVLCWYQGAYKFKTRYGFIGFSDKSSLDEGNMWPISFALTKLTATEEAKIMALIKRAVG
jgi:uncharacterized protein YdhG (YjbR/CyaY superfamily)